MAEAAFGAAEAEAVLREMFAPWVLDLGLSVDACGPAGVTLRMAFAERLCRVGGIVSGQALMALADTCMVLVTSQALGGFREMATVGQTTSFFRPVAGVDTLAVGRVLKPGRTLLFGEVTLTAEGDARPAAHVTSTYAIAPARG